MKISSRPSVEEGLADVRRALGRKETSRPEPLPPFVEAEIDFSEAELTAQFVAEVKAVGALVYQAQSAAAVASRIAEICRNADVCKIALSGAELFDELKLTELLASQNLQPFVTAEFSDTENAARPEKLIAELASCGVGVTAIDYAIAATGTLVISADEADALLVSLVPPRHIALLRPRQIFATIAQVIRQVNNDKMQRTDACRAATFITGPSRTSDIELRLSIGVHGPIALHIILLEDEHHD